MRIFVIIGLSLCFGCLTSAPPTSVGHAQGATCEQNLDCASGLYCLCQRCISQERQVYPSQCPHLSLISCDVSEGVCTSNCTGLSDLQDAECIENLWFCPNNYRLAQLCESDENERDASIPQRADASVE
jgi:hypothetical protein